MLSHRAIDLRIVYEENGRIHSHNGVREEHCVQNELIKHGRVGESPNQGCNRYPSREG